MKLWVTEKEAVENGCTHSAYMYFFVPGYFGVKNNVWIPKSDLLYPVQLLLEFLWNSAREFRNEMPDFVFKLGRRIGN